MDQQKIGAFLRELRAGKNLTQEQLAEKIGVSGRTVSRWENGNNMPDISIIVELAEFYDVDIRELLNGERKSENMKNEKVENGKMDGNLKETIIMVSEYTDEEKKKITKQWFTYAIGSVFFFGILFVILVFQLEKVHEAFRNMAVFSTTIGLIYSVMSIVRFKQLSGKMNKAEYGNTKIILLVLGIIGCIISVFLILFALGVK